MTEFLNDNGKLSESLGRKTKGPYRMVGSQSSKWGFFLLFETF